MSWLNKSLGTGVSLVLVNGAIQPQEGAIALVAGTNVTLTATDLPNAVPPQTQITIASSGSGGGSGPSTVTSTTASHAALTAATWQIVFCNSASGSYTQNLPTSGLVAGQIIWFKDVGNTTASDGIASDPITLNGGTNAIQNKHTMVTSATTYVWGGTSQDGGGDFLGVVWSGTAWVVIG